MREVTFTKLKIQGFLSVGKEPIEIDFTNGMNLITGKNKDNPDPNRSNGTGKSAVVEGFFYALYGETIRKIKKQFIRNNSTKSAGKLELSFNVKDGNGVQSYTIKRTLKPSAVELLKGTEDITADSIANTNQKIANLIGSNPTLTKSCDILSLSDNVPFMAKKLEDKKKFVDDIFSLEVFGKMMKDLKKSIKEVKDNMMVSSSKIEEIQHSISTLEKQKVEMSEKIRDRDKILNDRLEVLNTKKSGILDKLKDLNPIDVTPIREDIVKCEDALDIINKNVDKLKSDKMQLSGDVERLRKDISKYDLGEISTCDKCFQEVGHDHLKTLEESKSKLTEEVEFKINEGAKVTKKLEALLEKHSAIVKKIKLLQISISDNATIELEISNLNEILIEVEDSISNIKDESSGSSDAIDMIDKNIEDAVSRKEEETKIYSENKTKSEDFDMCKFILGEEGIKSYIIKKLVAILNRSIQSYISKLGMDMSCVFDEYLDEHMTNAEGVEISYWNLSGGERRTVDLACAWSFKELKKMISNTSSNLEFADEIFDSAFDARGLDILMDVVKDRISNGKMAVYVVSHRKEILPHIDGDVVYLEKENKITRRKDYVAI